MGKKETKQGRPDHIHAFMRGCPFTGKMGKTIKEYIIQLEKEIDKLKEVGNFW